MDSFLEKLSRVFPNMSPEVIEKLTNFKSVTKTVAEISARGGMVCPGCGNRINFNSKLDWYGPQNFTCSSCRRMLDMRIVAQALHDLGVEP